jgi:hypothetical protein
MFENPTESNPRSTIQVLLGILLGILVSLGCLFFSVFLGSALGLRREWMFPVLNALALVASGIIALRQWRESSYAQGILIAVSVALLLDAACGMALLR